MSTKDLEALEEDINLLRDQLVGKRRTLVTIAPEEKIRIEQQIAKLRKEIRNFEQQKWDLIAQLTSTSDIANDEAEAIVAELVAEGEAIASNPPDTAY